MKLGYTLNEKPTYSNSPSHVAICKIIGFSKSDGAIGAISRKDDRLHRCMHTLGYDLERTAKLMGSSMAIKQIENRWIVVICTGFTTKIKLSI
jgi:hypothetical protein